MFYKIFTVLLSFTVIGLAEKYSPHTIDQLPVQLKRTAEKQFTFSITLPFQSNALGSVIYCMRRLDTVSQNNEQSCYLQPAQTNYKCIQVNYTRSSLAFVLQQDWIELTYTPSVGFTQIGQNTVQVSVSFTDLIRKVTLKSDFLQQNTIYQLITATSRSLIPQENGQSQQRKNNYFHTYTHDSYFDTLITQRKLNCVIFQNKIIYIFEGAVLRDAKQHFFVGILTTTTDNQTFSMWGGYSFSTSHAGRDMFGYDSSTDAFYDLYSLYAAAPFEDIASNINGDKNVVRVSSSGMISTQQNVPYHFIQVYRLFDTGDNNGDELIRQKIYNSFCLVGYYQDGAANNDISVLSNSYKHQLIDCHYPDLTIYGKNLKQLCFIVLLILFIMIWM